MLNLVERHIINIKPLCTFEGLYSRRFTSKAKCKVLLVYEPERICYSQMYPFIYYRNAFAEEYGTQFRCVSSHAALAERSIVARDADVILLQTLFDLTKEKLQNIFEIMRRSNPRARISFMDSFAPTDLRLAIHLDDNIEWYITKTLLKDVNRYRKPFLGGTNLVEYYSKLYHLDDELIDWKTPSSFLRKVRIGPTFFTAKSIIGVFDKRDIPPLKNRTIDIHARLGTRGAPWYQTMREKSIEALERIDGIETRSGDVILWKKFLKELENSKLCYSPFGYGEICWRDIEAILCGSLLIKPDMGHVVMEPSIHVPNETYVPIAWDFSDLEEKVHYYLENDEERLRIANNAYDLVSGYVRSKQFVKQMGFLFK